jgi:hypothetical protein
MKSPQASVKATCEEDEDLLPSWLPSLLLTRLP